MHLKAAFQRLSKVELSYIDKIFKELSCHTDEGESLIRKPTWLNRDTFASKFSLSDFLGECLFAAFDRDQNGTIDVEEFLSGMALCLHGRVKDKCRLLFKIFNLDDDERHNKGRACNCALQCIIVRKCCSAKYLDTRRRQK